MAVELLGPGEVSPGAAGVQADQGLVIRKHELGLGAGHGPDLGLSKLDS